MNLLHDNLLVTKVPAAEKSGLIIISTASDKTQHDYKVVACGPAADKTKPGDVVRKFPNVAPIPYSEDGSDYYLLKEKSQIEFVNP